MPVKPPFAITFKPTFRGLVGRFAKATKRLLEEHRKSVRFLGQRWVEIAKEEAPVRTGAFRDSISFKTFVREKSISLRTYQAEPLGRWIILGTKPHKIRPRNKGALYFLWKKHGYYVVVPKGGGFKTHFRGPGIKLWIGKGYVDHPGTKPNPYNARAYDRWMPEVEKEIKRISTRFVVDLTRPAE